MTSTAVLGDAPAQPTTPSSSPTFSAETPGRPPRGGRLGRVWRGRPDDPRWLRPALLALLVGTAVLYIYGLDRSGWANSFYSAAVQAGSESWKAFFFGSSDASNSITVDKTPLSLWPMALSVRIFGLSSWSILIPQALEGVAAVGLLYATVRRATASYSAGLIAGGVLALTPVAVLMFKFNNPDAALVLLLIASVYAVLRAIDETKVEPGSPSHPVRWVALSGMFVGLAYLAKMLQAFLVLPALGLVYLWAANTTFGRRLLHLLAGCAAMVAAAGWWIAIVSLWPADSRPYIGGSQTNSILELTFGYNGFGRLTGDETGSVGGGGGWGETGIWRLFNSEIGGQIAWFLPAALLLLVAGLWITRKSPRTDSIRAALLVWGGWLLVTAITFSFMAGIFHAYYTVALAPAIAALVGIGAWQLWQHRDSLAYRAVASVAVTATAVMSFVLLTRSSDFLPWLRWIVLIGGVIVALLYLVSAALPRKIAAVVLVFLGVFMMAGPTAYAVQTAGTGHSGSIVTAGPSSGSAGGFGGRGAGQRNGQGGGMQPPTGGGTGNQGFPGLGGTGQGGTGQGGTGQGTGQNGFPGTGGTGGTGGFGGNGSVAGGLLNGSEPTQEITDLLKEDADEYDWVAAAVGSNSASGYQLASEEPVMAIGGFNGSDPSPTLAEFQQYVEDGRIHYFIAGGNGGGASPGGSTSGEIAEWVEENFTSVTVDGVTLYDLSDGATS